jgi:IclR family KDG regulon transcriptional repressor
VTDKTIVKGLALLEALADSEQPRGVTELARQFGWAKSNAHRLLATLVNVGYVQRDSGRYTLSLKMWEVGTRVLGRLNVRTIALPHMRELSKATGETVHLSTYDRDHVVYLEQVETPHPVRAYSRVGGVGPAHCTATGKAMLAFLPSEVIENVARDLTRYTDTTITSKSELFREVAKVRKAGFAVTHEEWRKGVSGVAAPIFGSDGQVVAAVGISGPVERLDEKAMRKVGPLVRGVANRISAELGHNVARLDNHRGFGIALDKRRRA